MCKLIMISKYQLQYSKLIPYNISPVVTSHLKHQSILFLAVSEARSGELTGLHQGQERPGEGWRGTDWPTLGTGEAMGRWEGGHGKVERREALPCHALFNKSPSL